MQRRAICHLREGGDDDGGGVVQVLAAARPQILLDCLGELHFQESKNRF